MMSAREARLEQVVGSLPSIFEQVGVYESHQKEVMAIIRLILNATPAVELPPGLKPKRVHRKKQSLTPAKPE